MKYFLVSLLFFCLVYASLAWNDHRIKKRFNWRQETNVYWSENCDWKDNDLSNVQIPSQQCGSRCAQRSGCTHFTWTNYNGGTCWMKKNAVSLDKAQYRQEYSVCGMMKSSSTSSQFNWREEGNLYWAENCDWNDNDLSNVKIPGEQCGSKCAQTSGCTHFIWTNYNGGTCWMKKNAVNRDQAKTIQEYSVCGIMKSTGPAPAPSPSSSGSVTVKGTRWADTTDAGGCQMPQGDYRIQHAVALGQAPELGSLVWRNGLCGQVLRVNCGGQPVEAVVASTCNLGSRTCGVDMISKTWSIATGNKPPGIAQCTVQLTNTNPLNDNTPVCFFRPTSGSQAYYASLGVFNTNGRIVQRAVAAGVNGKFQSGSGYFDFDSQGSPKFTDTATVVFYFEDSSSASFQLKDCRNNRNVYIWS